MSSPGFWSEYDSITCILIMAEALTAPHALSLVGRCCGAAQFHLERDRGLKVWIKPVLNDWTKTNVLSEVLYVVLHCSVAVNQVYCLRSSLCVPMCVHAEGFSGQLCRIYSSEPSLDWCGGKRINLGEFVLVKMYVTDYICICW